MIEKWWYVVNKETTLGHHSAKTLKECKEWIKQQPNPRAYTTYYSEFETPTPPPGFTVTDVKDIN